MNGSKILAFREPIWPLFAETSFDYGKLPWSRKKFCWWKTSFFVKKFPWKIFFFCEKLSCLWKIYLVLKIFVCWKLSCLWKISFISLWRISLGVESTFKGTLLIVENFFDNENFLDCEKIIWLWKTSLRKENFLYYRKLPWLQKTSLIKESLLSWQQKK